MRRVLLCDATLDSLILLASVIQLDLLSFIRLGVSQQTVIDAKSSRAVSFFSLLAPLPYMHKLLS